MSITSGRGIRAVDLAATDASRTVLQPEPMEAMTMPHQPQNKRSRIEAEPVPGTADAEIVASDAERDAECRRVAAAEVDRILEEADITEADPDEHCDAVFIVTPLMLERKPGRNGFGTNHPYWVEIEKAVMRGVEAVQRVRRVVKSAEGVEEDERQIMLGRIDTYLLDFEDEAEAERLAELDAD